MWGLQGKDYLVIIVGKGNHSKDHVAKIKPAIEQLAREENLNMIPQQAQPGLRLHCAGGRGQDAGRKSVASSSACSASCRCG